LRAKSRITEAVLVSLCGRFECHPKKSPRPGGFLPVILLVAGGDFRGRRFGNGTPVKMHYPAIPPKKFNRENLKFGLKLAPITSGL